MSRKTKARVDNLTPTLTKLVNATRDYSFAVDDSLPRPLSEAHPIVLGYDVVRAGEKLMAPEVLAKLERMERANPNTRCMYTPTDSETSRLAARINSVAHLIRLPFPQCWFEFTPDYRMPFFTANATALTPSLEYATGIFASEEQVSTGGRRIIAWVSGVSSGVVGGQRIALPYDPYVAMHVDLQSSNEAEDVVTNCELLVYREPKNRSITSCEDDCSTRAGIEIYILRTLLTKVLPIINSPAVCTGAEVATRSIAFSGKGRPIKHTVTTAIKFSTTREYQAQIKADDELESDAVRRGVHAHFVRGHFKHKKNGLFWWNAHIRGVGTPEVKQYEITR